ncbi:MAG: UDP-glucose 4-epimerase [Rhodothermales bacterium]|jgi:UDP-glucose 4-epimerase
MSILVTGGAGYIGSIFVEQLRQAGQAVVVLDNLCRGHRASLHPDVPFVQGNIGERELVSRVVEAHAVEACVHFAALIEVGESVKTPDLFFRNNVEEAAALLDALNKAGVRRFVFSSTCATYGEPKRLPLDETHPQHPNSPYGWTKFFMERMLEAYASAYDWCFVGLRYFNAAGGTPERGEDHKPETHLIPNVIYAAQGRRDKLFLFGDDYDTADGTCVRDYIHVSDLGAAHQGALDYLRGGGAPTFINIGTGTGYTVKQVVESVERVTGLAVPYEIYPRRAGDTSTLVANNDKARDLLAWQPQYTGLDEIVSTAWEWHRKHPNGYND